MSKECNIIRDLLPLYLEDMVSEDTVLFIENHLNHCEECRVLFNLMKDENNKINEGNSIIDNGSGIKKIKRRLKTKSLITIILTALLTLGGLLGFIHFLAYSNEYIDGKDAQIVQVKYDLILEDMNWRYTKYEKDTILSKPQQRVDIHNFSLEIFPSHRSEVTISVTNDDEFFSLALPWINSQDEVKMERIVNIHNCEILVKVISAATHQGYDAYEGADKRGGGENTYVPKYFFSFKKDGINYNIQMESWSNEIPAKDFYYRHDEKDIHDDELNGYLKFLEEIVIFK